MPNLLMEGFVVLGVLLFAGGLIIIGSRDHSVGREEGTERPWNTISGLSGRDGEVVPEPEGEAVDEADGGPDREGRDACPACGAAVVREVLFSIPEEAFVRQEQELRQAIEEGRVPAWVEAELDLKAGENDRLTVVVELASCVYCDEGRVRFLPGRGDVPLAEASSRPEVLVGTDAGESLHAWLARRSGSAEPSA